MRAYGPQWYDEMEEHTVEYGSPRALREDGGDKGMEIIAEDLDGDENTEGTRDERSKNTDGWTATRWQ